METFKAGQNFQQPDPAEDVTVLLQGELDEMTFKSPFQHKLFFGSMISPHIRRA